MSLTLIIINNFLINLKYARTRLDQISQRFYNHMTRKFHILLTYWSQFFPKPPDIYGSDQTLICQILDLGYSKSWQKNETVSRYHHQDEQVSFLLQQRSARCIPSPSIRIIFSSKFYKMHTEWNWII